MNSSDALEEGARFRSLIGNFLSKYASQHRLRSDLTNQVDRAAIPILAGSGMSVEEETQFVERCRNFQRGLFDAGLGWITGPTDLGGGAFPQEYESKLRTELSGQGFPDDSLIRTGTQVIGPTLLRMGTDHIRQQHLPKIHRGDDLVCQLFSEPDAGSDLANIKTVADEVAGGWKITGQKVWSSGSVHSDLGMCVARTERGSSRHAGLSVFLIDMSVPGVEVRKIRQMTGGAEFCEVFLTDVFVDLDHLIGEVGQGWKIVTDVLMNERSSIGGELLPAVEMLERLQNLYLNLSTSNAAIRDALAKVIINYRVSQMLTSRLKSKYGENEAPGPELAMTKLSITNVMMEMSSVASMLLGAKLIADNGEVGTYTWSEFVLGVPGIRIGGGTDEVLKNGIGERVLGLARQ